MTTTDSLQTITFDSAQEWEAWLLENHASSKGVWLRFFKKDSGKKAVTYAEALDEALCYGWIDGQAKKYDEMSWLQKFTPRRPRSVWSKRNTERVERLMEEGRMRPAGVAEVEAAKGDGRWQRAYDSPSKMDIPEDFLEKLSKTRRRRHFSRR
jgi:uncharacterized protein YdeI (YjbR/CyaY-like superfamily)